MSDSPAPDHVLTDGWIHTLDPEAGVVQALAIRDGKVLAAGTSESIMRLAGNATEVTALHGRCVLPGLTDSHLHLQHLAFSLARIDCDRRPVTSMAPSSSTPVSSPSGVRSSRPSGGLAVSRSRPARDNAAELAQPACMDLAVR